MVDRLLREGMDTEEGEKIKRAIDAGQLNAKAYFKDDSKKYVWKVLEEGEDHFDPGPGSGDRRRRLRRARRIIRPLCGAQPSSDEIGPQSAG